MTSCLSDKDIDSLIMPILGSKYIPARVMYDLQSGVSTIESVLSRIYSGLSTTGWCLVPVWTRHHWATTIVRYDGNMHATVYDSAAAPPTCRDFMSMWKRLGISANVVQHCRQPRNSLECGLHVCMIALIVSVAAVPPQFTNSLTVTNLGLWRRELVQNSVRAMTPSALARCVPWAATWLSAEAKPPVVGGSTSSFPIDSHRKPREKALAGTGNPIEIIDDEAAHANVPFSREQILSLSRPVDRPAIEKWFTTLHAARLETLGGPPRHSLPETMAPLRTLPERLEHLREPLEKLARSAVKAKAAATTAQSWDCWQEGSMVTTTVVDTIVRVLAKHFPQHLILESLPFAVFANHGRGAGTLVNSTNVKNLIAVIAHIPGHFVLLTHRLGNSHVELLDSLSASTTASALSGALQFVSDRFAALLGTIDRNVTTVVRMPCAGQRTNDCAIEAIRNLMGTIGLSKHRTHEKLFDRSVIQKVWIATSTGKHPSDVIEQLLHWTRETPTPTRYRNDPYEGRIMLNAKAPSESAISPCCGREKIIGPWCAWHHPLLTADVANQQQCQGTSGKKQNRCRENAISSKDRAWRYCWYHLPPIDKQRLVESLREPVQVAPSTTTMTESDVRSFAAVCQPQALVELRTTNGPGIRRLLGFIDSNPTGSTFEARARFCDACGEWHEVPHDREPLPDGDTTYTLMTIAKNQPEYSIDCENAEDGSDCGEERADVEELRTSTAKAQDNLRDTLLTPSVSPAGAMRADIAQRWFIFNDRPPHVHQTVWAEMTPATRKAHIRWLQRLKAAPPELHRTQLSTAAVEVVLRMANERQWSWPTISSSLSTLATAVKNVSLYTNSLHGSDLRTDPYYGAALRYAQKRARHSSINPKKCAPLTLDDFQKLSKSLQGGPWVLLQLSWFFAGRVGDTRQIEPRNLHFGSTDIGTQTIAAHALFTAGKGLHCWGPYTIHTRIPTTIATALREHITRFSSSATVCTTQDQQVLSRALAELPDHSLRSIRKGSLTFLADCGVDDSALQLVSGHKRKDTLLRYLGWGQRSSEAERSALHRAQLVAAPTSTSMANSTAPVTAGSHPMWAGFNSGFNGDKRGRRVAEPPTLFPLQAPNAQSLGIVQGENDEDSSQWPLHAKDVPCLLDVGNSYRFVASADLREATRLGLAWLRDDASYGISWPPLVEKQLPYASFTALEITTMLQVGKIRPLRPDEAIRSGVRAFTVEQAAKRRKRPIFEPLNNACINREALPPLRYTSRSQRRDIISHAKFFLQFDFAGYYDQFPIHEDVQNCYVMRSRLPVTWDGASHTLFALTRVPMGASWSAHTAQTLTWAILEPVLHDHRVRVVTMIDNVAIMSDEPEAFTSAVSIFLERCRLFGATLNDTDTLPSSPSEILRQGRMTIEREETFLGEVYTNGKVRNTSANVAKLGKAFARLQAALMDDTIIVSRRHIAALIGLTNFLAHTVGVPPRDLFDIVRMYSRVAAMPSCWDQPLKVTPHMVTTIGQAIGPLLANEPTTPPPLPSAPSYNNKDYDVIAIVDASATGFGAFVLINGDIMEVKGGWRTSIRHSAWAEPIGALEIVRWIRSKSAGRIALVTDHSALAKGQRRPISGNGGFSHAFHPLLLQSITVTV
eukprot:PhM_4_TR16751/c0_g1_i3/m.26827